MAPLATIGILSIGDMGMGIAKLLITQSYRVATNTAGRSEHTIARCKSTSIEMVQSDLELVNQCDYIFSIVPPDQSLPTARRISSALRSTTRSQPNPLYFLDLNATSPLSVQKWISEFADLRERIHLLDGGIIGGPPHMLSQDSASAAGLPDVSVASLSQLWYRPSLVLSGPSPLDMAPVSGSHLASVLNVRHVHSDFGPASGLKMCFASMNKGFTAIATQAMATASQLGVLSELQSHLKEYSPALGATAERTVPNMCPKAYRWIQEMNEIAETMRVFGGWAGMKEESASKDSSMGRAEPGDLFGAASEIYKVVMESSLGKERIGARERGTTAEDVANVLAEELKPEKKTTH